MNLLANLPQRNYPTDYLLARLKGRKSLLINNWAVYLAKPIPDSLTEMEAWQRLLLELRWVCRQMNKELRKTMAPLFFFFELRTLILSLRYKVAGEDKKNGELLALSLLPDALRSIMQQDVDLDQLLDKLANYFPASSKQLVGLPAVYGQVGLRGVEQMLNRCYLEQVVTTKLHPAVKSFLQYHIDFNNIIGLAKSFRWNLKTPPSFIKGGGIPLKQLLRSHSAGLFDGSLFSKKIHITKTISGEELALLENSFLKILSKHYQRMGRVSDPIHQIIDYLWRRYMEKRNLGLLVHGAAISTNLLAAELIQ